MELTTKGRYAVMAMADLASHADQAAIPLSLVAERQHLPLAYLEQLFVPLRRTGLVESARGRSGGYRLAKAARPRFRSPRSWPPSRKPRVSPAAPIMTRAVPSRRPA